MPAILRTKEEVREAEELKYMKYWSNAAGDLFNPNRPPSKNDISEAGLPEELKDAWNNLWNEDTGSYCYLVQNGDEYGVALINEYEKEDKMCHEDVRGRAREVLKMAKAENIDLKVYAGLEEGYGEYGMTDELITIFPYDTDPKDFSKVADFLYNSAYHKDVTYDMYLELKGKEEEKSLESQDTDTLTLVKEAYEHSDLDKAAEYMAQTLMGDENGSYKMFEELASDYINGNEDYRKGLDDACTILTGLSMRTLSQNVIENCREEELER